MSIQLRRASERGFADHGWLRSFHTFSFAGYHDPAHMGFRALRVINEDRVQPSRGFGMHGHQNMEIISYVLEGALEHKDSMGTGSVIRPGEVQRMTAGTGVHHSEHNASKTDLVHFLQIWILPAQAGLTPSYEQKAFSAEARTDQLLLVASPDGRDGSITVHQDVRLLAGLLDDGAKVPVELARGRHAWVQVARGSVELDGHRLEAGDGAAISDQTAFGLTGQDPGGPAEVLIFDLA